MGDPPRAGKPGKLLESVCYCTFVLWPLEGGNWGSPSLRVIAPHVDRGELSFSATLSILEFQPSFQISRIKARLGIILA